VLLLLASLQFLLWYFRSIVLYKIVIANSQYFLCVRGNVFAWHFPNANTINSPPVYSSFITLCYMLPMTWKCKHDERTGEWPVDRHKLTRKYVPSLFSMTIFSDRSVRSFVSANGWVILWFQTKNDFNFWLTFGLSPNLGLCKSLSELQKTNPKSEMTH